MVMTLEEVRSWFAQQGLPIEWLTDSRWSPAMPLVLRPPPDEPLELDVEVAIVIPDVHLGAGSHDCFQETSPGRVDRLERFLDVLRSLRDALPPIDGRPRFAAVQLGDWFDFFRTGLLSALDFRSALDRIESAYRGVVSRARALPLLHCIGNHDAAFFRYRAELQGMNVNVVRSIGDGVICFHGHDNVSLRDILVDTSAVSLVVNLFQSLADVPLAGQLEQAITRIGDDSLADPILSRGDLTSLPWAKDVAAGAGVPGWTAPWTVRDARANYGGPLLDWQRRTRRRLDVAVLGHSHRPGISWTEVDLGHRVALVDAGSWTFGRTSFAVVCADGVGIATFAQARWGVPAPRDTNAGDVPDDYYAPPGPTPGPTPIPEIGAVLLPPEGDRHAAAKRSALESLQAFFATERRDLYVSSDLAVMYPGQPWFIPDLLAVAGAEPAPRARWSASDEGRGIDWALDIVVSEARRELCARNVELFAQLGIQEYFIFDLTGGSVNGYRLEAPGAGVYKAIEPQGGRHASTVLGLEMMVVAGALRFYQGTAELLDAAGRIARLEQALQAHLDQNR